MMIPNTMLSPIVVTMTKKETSKSNRKDATLNSAGTRGTIYIEGKDRKAGKKEVSNRI